MDLETIFSFANLLALLGWAALLLSPFRPELADRVATIAVPGLLAAAYAGLILAFWSSGEGGFGSLAEVSLLFQTP